VVDRLLIRFTKRELGLGSLGVIPVGMGCDFSYRTNSYEGL
jgi:hypothetical protein